MIPETLKVLDIATLAYIAGLVDGEGCLHAAVQKRLAARNVTGLRVDFTKCVTVQMTDRSVIEWLAEVTGVGTVTRHAPSKRRCGTKPIWNWRILGAGPIVQFLRAIRPYLRVKAEQADMLIELCELQLLSTTQHRHEEEQQAQLVAMLREAKVA